MRPEFDKVPLEKTTLTSDAAERLALVSMLLARDEPLSVIKAQDPKRPWKMPEVGQRLRMTGDYTGTSWPIGTIVVVDNPSSWSMNGTTTWAVNCHREGDNNGSRYTVVLSDLEVI